MIHSRVALAGREDGIGSRSWRHRHRRKYSIAGRYDKNPVFRAMAFRKSTEAVPAALTVAVLNYGEAR
jgi:hypothetical protein